MSIHCVADAKSHLPAWIDRALAGDKVVITRHGHPVVELCAVVAPTPRVTSDDSHGWMPTGPARSQPGKTPAPRPAACETKTGDECQPGCQRHCFPVRQRHIYGAYQSVPDRAVARGNRQRLPRSRIRIRDRAPGTNRGSDGHRCTNGFFHLRYLVGAICPAGRSNPRRHGRGLRVSASAGPEFTNAGWVEHRNCATTRGDACYIRREDGGECAGAWGGGGRRVRVFGPMSKRPLRHN